MSDEEFRVVEVKKAPSFSHHPEMRSMLRANWPVRSSLEGASGMNDEGAVGMKTPMPPIELRESS